MYSVRYSVVGSFYDSRGRCWRFAFGIMKWENCVVCRHCRKEMKNGLRQQPRAAYPGLVQFNVPPPPFLCRSHDAADCKRRLFSSLYACLLTLHFVFDACCPSFAWTVRCRTWRHREQTRCSVFSRRRNSTRWNDDDSARIGDTCPSFADKSPSRKA